jgi:hypothetical protein
MATFSRPGHARMGLRIQVLVILLFMRAHRCDGFVTTLSMVVQNTNHARKADAYGDAVHDPLAPVVILVREPREDHIGMVARNLLNFGIGRLRLVDCQCDHLSGNTIGYSSGAGNIVPLV